MLKFIFTYLLFINLLNASILLETDPINLKSFEIEYYVDESQKMNFEQIKTKKFTNAVNEKSLSSHHTHLWLKVKINNQSLKNQRLFLHHTSAYRLKHIEFYETQKNKLLNNFDINLYNTQDTQHMYGTDAIYKFTLEPNETKTIYIKTTSFIYQYYSLMLFDEEHSAKYLISGQLSIVIILSTLAGLMLYHFILYLITFFKDYLYYSLYLFFNILWGSYEYGLMGKYLGWYGERYFIFDLMIIFAFIFVALFIKNILQMSKLYPLENQLAKLIIAMHLLNFSYILVDIYTTLYIFSVIASISALIYIYIIISIYRKKDPYIFYILFAQFWFISFNFITLFFYEGLIEYNFWTRYSYILGVFLDTFAFSYLLSHRIRLLQEEHKKSIHKTQRLNALSELLENISQQWRQPLTRINTSVMHIAIEMKKHQIHNNTIDKKLDGIENLSVYLSKTIDDFKSLYRQDQEKSLFNLKNTIEHSLSLIHPEYQKHNIHVSLDIPHTIYLHNYMSELNQVLQVILNNAKDALLSNKTKKPQLLIRAEKKTKQVVLKISNNGGEIDQTIIHKVFDAHFTTKKQGEGIGLFMSQKIIQELMNAHLSCHNITGGVCFEIKFDI